jgi:hypothetical protein
MNELQNLYNSLQKRGYYTKSFGEFKTQWQDKAYRNKVYSIASRDGLYTKSKDEFLTKYSGGPSSSTTLKKKASTASGSKLAKPTSVSSSKEVRRDYDGQVLPGQEKWDASKYKKLGNTYYDGEGEIFNNYPGKEGKAYRFNKGQWYEYSSTKNIDNPNAPAVEQLKKPIKDPMRVQALNKQFKKWGTTDKGVFLGYPGKEQNEYRVVNNQWQRRTPENRTWVNVTNQDSVTALNNHFKKQVQFEPEKVDKLKQDNIYSKSFDTNIKSINSELVGKSQDDVIQELRKRFPAANGWQFDYSNPINRALAGAAAVDRVTVTAPNGQKQMFTLDNWTWDDDKRNAQQMIGWMEQNNLTPSQKEIHDRYKKATVAQGAGAKEEVETIVLPGGGSLNIQKPVLNEMNLRNEEVAKQARAEWMPIKSQKVQDIKSQYSAYISDKGAMDKHTMERAQAALGALAEDKETIRQVNAYQNDVKNNRESYKTKYKEAEIYVKSLGEKYLNGEITKEQLDIQVGQKEKELLEQEQEINNQIKVSDNLTRTANMAAAENLLVQETKGSLGGGLTLSFIKGLASPVRLIEGAMGMDTSAAAWQKQVTDAIAPFWDYETSLEYLRSEERPDLYKAGFSVAESLGAMAPLAATGGATLLGEGVLARGAMTAAAFYPMSYYEMKDELENIDMPEADKIAMSSIYGLISSAFESVGMEYAMGKISGPAQGLIKRQILKSVLGKTLPKNASKEFIDALVRTETKAYLANAVQGTLSAGLVEGGTEFAQSMIGSGIKESYDIANKTNFFNNKGFGDVVKGALYEGYLGALGGGMVHSIYTSSDAYKRNRAMNSKELGLLMMAAKTNGMSETLMTNLKADLLSGRMTKAEAADIANNFETVRGNMNQMPENLTPEAQSVSLSLMMERDKLNKQVEGKDPNLVKPQTTRIAEINNRLQQISEENAVQEQSTGEVPVQPTPGVSTEMEERVPGTEVEGVTRETVREETQVEQAQAALDEKKKKFIDRERGSIQNSISQLETELENESISDVDRSLAEEIISERKAELEELDANPVQYVQNKLEEFTSGPINESYQEFYDALTAEPTQEPVAETTTTQAENIFDVTEPAQSFEFTQDTVPTELQDVEPISSSEVTVGRGRNRTTTTKVVFSGQQMIDAGIGRLATQEEVAPEMGTATSAIEVAPTIEIAPALEAELATIYEAEQSGETLTPEQQKVVNDNEQAYNQVVSSKTLQNEVSALDQLIGGTTTATTTPNFQLSEEDKGNKEKIEERKAKLEEQASAAMERIQPEIANEAYESQEPTKGTVKADIKQNEELTQGVPRKSIREYIGKKMNLLMADLLKVDLNNKIKKMGGAFFPLIPGLRGKVAWASIDIAAAKAIIRGAIKSDISMVYNMNPEAMMSNKVFLESVLDRISKLPDADVVFTQMMERIQKLKYQEGKKPKAKIHDVAKSSKTMEEFKQNFADLNVDQKAAIMKSILPEQGTDYSNSKIDVFRTLSKDGITKQSMLAENVEQFASDLPAGALTMALNIVDENGNRPTEDTIDNFIITREQAIEMGLPIHENYPIYIKGNVDAILTETASFWDVLKDFKRSVDAKIANLIQKKDSYIVEKKFVDKKGNKGTKDVVVKVYNNPNGTTTVEVFNDTEAKGEGEKLIISPEDNITTEEFIKKNVGKVKSFSQGGRYSAKEALSSTMRSASMKASSVFKITEPMQSKYQQFVERLSKAFPTVSVATSQEEFDSMIDEIKSGEVGGKQLVLKNQKVYGAVYNGKLYLNPSLENYNTPIHEFGHIWLNVAKSMKPALYKKGLELIKGSEYLDQVKSSAEYARVVKAMQAQGFSQEEIEQYLEEEALATAIGDKGESFVSAATKRSFNNWLTEVFEFVKKLTGISDVTAEELENMSLDEFVQGVVVDIMSENQQFKDAEIASFGSQLQLMTGPSGLSMRDIISIGRNARFSDAAIKQVLMSQGFKAKDIDPAMEVQINLTDAMPSAFGNLEGGAQQGIKLFNDVRNELDTFARGVTTTTRAPKMTTAERAARIAELRQQNPTLTEISDSELLKRFPRPTQKSTTTTTKPTMAEVRAKAKEILSAHPIFQAQNQTTQMQLLSAFDKTLGTRAGKVIQSQITAIRNNLKQRKIGAKELQDAKVFLKDLIRRVLPKSEGYSQKQINSLLNVIAKANENTIMRDTDKVLAIVEEQREKMKMSTIKDMVTMAIKKAKPALTSTGKRRSAGLDAEGRSYFVAVGSILKAAYKGDQAFLDNVKQELSEAENDGRMQKAIDKQLNREKLTKKEQDLLNKAMAYDTFANIMGMELEQVNDLNKLIKSERTQSIMNLAANRAARSAYYAALNEEASKQVRDQNPELFKEEVDENGDTVVVPKDKNDLQREKKEIFNIIRKGKIVKGIRRLSKNWNFSTIPYVSDFFRNYISHLGTLMNLFDNNAKAQTFFTDNVYRPLNKMDEQSKKGYYQQINALNRIANSIDGITKGYKQIRNALQTGGHIITINGKQETLNSDALLRIYALSKNNVQREILERQGFTDDVIEQIKTIVGPQAVEFTDKVVDYLSNEYYESVNDVYSSVNDVNLGYVDNYFPTSKVKSDGPKFDPQDADFYGIFNAETAPSLHERTDKKSDIDLNFDFTDVLDNHFQNMERYKAHAEGVKTLNAIFQNPDVVAMLDATQTKMLVKNAINLAITPNFGMKSKQTFLGKLQTKMTGFALAFKVVQILKQSTSFIQAFEDYSFLSKDSKVPGIISRPIDYLGFMVDSALVLITLPKQVKQAYGMSANVRDRLEKGIQGDVYGLESGARLFRPIDKRSDIWGRARRALKTGAAAPTIIGDVLGVMGYMVNYNRNIKNGMSQEQALEAFNNYNATLQTRRSTEKSAIQMSNNELIRAFTMFGSTGFLQMNKVAQSYKNMMDSIKSKKMPAKNDVRALLINLGAANALFVLASNLAKYAKGDDDDKEEVLKQIRRAMLGLNLVENIPLLDTGVKSVLNYFDGDERKQEREVTNPFMTLWWKMKNGIKGDDTWKTVQPLIEMVLGAQFDPAISIYNGFHNDEFSDDDIYTILGVSKSYRPTPNKLRESLIKEGTYSDEEIEEIVKDDKYLKAMESAQEKQTKTINKIDESYSNGEITDEEYESKVSDAEKEYEESIKEAEDKYGGGE